MCCAEKSCTGEEQEKQPREVWLGEFGRLFTRVSDETKAWFSPLCRPNTPDKSGEPRELSRFSFSLLVERRASITVASNTAREKHPLCQQPSRKRDSSTFWQWRLSSCRCNGLCPRHLPYIQFWVLWNHRTGALHVLSEIFSRSGQQAMPKSKCSRGCAALRSTRMTTARCSGVATLNVSWLQLIKGRMLILSQRESVAI